MADFTLDYLPASRSWDSVDVHARLFRRISKLPLEFVSATVEPAGIVVATKDDVRSDENTVVLVLELKTGAEKAADFLEKIQQPLTLTVECKPAPEAAATSAILFDDERVIRTVPIHVQPPTPTVTLVKPDRDPIPGDGNPSEIVLEFKMPDGTLAGGVDVGWELVLGEPTPGGEVDPKTVALPADGDGKATFHYTPPKLTYAPGRKYEQPLKVYWSPGGRRSDIADLDLHVNPELVATIDAEKSGVVFDPPYDVKYAAGNAPEEIEFVIGFREPVSRAADAQAGGTNDWKFPHRDAKPIVTVEADGAHVDVPFERTAMDGTVKWQLPELKAGLAKSQSEFKSVKLEPYEKQPKCDFGEDATRALDRYYAYTRQADVAALLDRLLSHAVMREMKDQTAVMGRRIAEGMEADTVKAIFGCDLVNAGARGTVMVAEVEKHLLDDGLDQISRLLWDVVDIAFEAFKVGDKLMGFFKSAPAPVLKGRGSPVVPEPGYLSWAAKWSLEAANSTLRVLRRAMEQHMPNFLNVIDGLIHIIDELLAGAAQIADVAVMIVTTFKEFFTAMMSWYADYMIENYGYSAEGADKFKPGSTGKKVELGLKLAAKGLQKVVQKAGASSMSYQEVKDTILGEISSVTMAATAETSMGKLTGNVRAGLYPYEPNAPVAYQMALIDFDKKRTELAISASGHDACVYMFGLLCSAVSAAVGVIGGMSGVAAPIAFEFCTAINGVKMAVSSFTHAGDGIRMVSWGFYFLDEYERLTLELVGEAPA